MKKVLISSLAVLFVCVSFNLLGADEETLKKLDIFSKVLHYIENEYVDEVNTEELIEGAIKGMLKTLDPHTSYLSEDIYKELKIDTAGRFGGIGVEIMARDGNITVVTPIEGTPADKAGLEPGDRIIKIGDKRTKDLTLAEAVAKIRGPRGSKVDITVERDGSDKPFNLSIVRTIVRVPSVKSEMLGDGYGYVRIVNFQSKTSKELRAALKTFHKRGDIKGLILDVRRNPGGLLDEAIKIVDTFLEDGTIVTTESRKKEVDKKVATKDGTEPQYPMIVLVDGGSASASEIVAGALQDHKRAVILGKRSFGKGSVQTVVDLDDNTALKLTVARYYTPKGRSIQAEGIVPDIEVDAIAPEENSKRLIREADLKGHLEGDKKNELKIVKLDDYQKKMALDYLKSWDIFRKNTSK